MYKNTSTRTFSCVSAACLATAFTRQTGTRQGSSVLMYCYLARAPSINSLGREPVGVADTSTASYFSSAADQPNCACEEVCSYGWFLFNFTLYVLLRGKTCLKHLSNGLWKPFQKKLLMFWPCTHKHTQRSYRHPRIRGHFLPHMFVMQFSHSHNDVKSKPTDVSTKTPRSPTVKHLYIWEVLMCDINILPSKATMYTRTSKAISAICTQKHARRHTWRIFFSVVSTQV